jgi:Arc-like DNA binding domain
MRRKPSETVQFKLRFPERLRVRIEAEAKMSGRSMNADIVHRLEQSLAKEDSARIFREVISKDFGHVIEYVREQMAKRNRKP